MLYLNASLDDLKEIINLKNEVKSRVIKENLAIWLGDYPTDTLIEDDIRNGYGKIIKDNDKIIGYAACHLSETEYSMDAFCYKKLYTFSRLMVADAYLSKGVGSYLIKSMLNEFKDKTVGFGLIVDKCNVKAINLYQKLGFRFESYVKESYGNFLTYTYYYKDTYTNNLNYDLAKLSDFKYQQFVKKLYKTNYKILGIRMPELRKYSKNLDLNFFSNIEFNRARIFGPLGIKSKARTLKSSTRLFDEIPNKTILNSEWEYIDAMFQKDIVDFRAVALVTGKNLWDSQTEAYRKSFIKSGYLEGIIELPQKALPNTGVHLFLLVLSNQNKQVKLLDASDLIIKNKNRFSDYERVANLDIGGILDQYFDDRCVKSIEEVLRFKNLTPSITNVKKKEIQNGVRLSDIADVFTGNQYTIKNFSGMLSDVETGYSILTSNDIADFYINLSSLRHINYSDGKLDKYAIQNGDVIVTSKSSKVKVGVVDFEPKERIIVTGGMIIIRPNKEKLNPIYLKAFLDSELGQQELRMIQKGSIIVSINAKDLSNIDVPYLDIKKQEQIAKSYQNNVSSLIALKEEAREIENKLKNILDERKTE